jgi:hypothetical protein
MNSCMFKCVISHLIGCKLGVVGLSSRRSYHVVYEEFPCCLVCGCLSSVGAVVCMVLRF